MDNTKPNDPKPLTPSVQGKTVPAALRNLLLDVMETNYSKLGKHVVDARVDSC